MDDKQIKVFDEIFGALDDALGNDEADGLTVLGAILAMPDEQFEVVKPTLFSSIESTFNAPEAAVVTEPRLALVKQAGSQYAQSGEIDGELLHEIGSPMIPEEQYAAIVNGGM